MMEDDYAATCEDEYLFQPSHLYVYEDMLAPDGSGEYLLPGAEYFRKEFKKAIAEADLITLGVGGNDWGAYLGWVIADILEKENYGDKYAKMAKDLIDNGNMDLGTVEKLLEVAHLAGVMAAELGVDQYLARRAGLLHDLGKAVDFEMEGSHIEIGVRLAKKYGERPEVIHAIEAHHDDVTANTIEAVLVKLADAISAGRPGARRDTLEIYIKRLQKIEEIVNSYEGIKQSFAVQAGREVRVIVQSEMFDDLASQKLARDIAKKIEDELDYPGQIKVTVVREFRTTEIAK
jgi:putative nucleotidyltransferase with HDIG domain